MKLYDNDTTAVTGMASLLNKRKESGLYRELKNYSGLIDFCSNDYLGLSRSERLAEATTRLLTAYNDERINGSTGSRLLSGNNSLVLQLEKIVAEYHNAEAALIFNSGYDANLGFFSCVPQEGDTVIYDELIHASVHDGIRLGKAQSFMFRHNNLEHLKERLDVSKGEVYVVVESVYSMDGDKSPLKEIAALCKNYNAKLVVDEAHATGIYGDKGEGLVVELKLEKEIFTRIHTFGKAMGCHGAAILGSNTLRDFLINYSRSFIYSTSLPPHSVASVMAAYELLPAMNAERNSIRELITLFRDQLSSNNSFTSIQSESPIQCIIVSGNDNVRDFSQQIINNGFDVRPVFSPTVPKGKERIRICLHSFNTAQEVENLFKTIRSSGNHVISTGSM